VDTSENEIVIGGDSSVVSDLGIGVYDLEDIQKYTGRGPPAAVAEECGVGKYGTFLCASAYNRTSVRVAGHVEGAVGAIVLQGEDDAVILEPGYEIVGQVNAGEGGESEGDTLAFGGEAGTDTFDFSLVDGDGTADGNDQYFNFELYRKIEGSRFNIVGDNDEIELLTLEGGELFVNSSLSNAFIPMSPETLLGGEGTVGGIDAAANSTVAPGNSIGTLSVTGNVRFRAGSIFEVEIEPTNLNSDLLAVGGDVTIDGGLINVLALPGNYPDAAEWTIITADLVTGEFDDVVDDLPDIDVEDGYFDDHVILFYTTAAPGGETSPKENAPAALLSAFNFAESLQERSRFLELLANLQAAAALNYLETPAAAAGAGMGAVLGTQGDAAGYAATPGMRLEGYGLWAGALADFQEADEYDAEWLGLAGGVERVFGDAAATSLIGAGVGYTTTDVSVTAGGADIESGYIGLYGAHHRGPVNLSGALAYAWNWYDLFRTVTPGVVAKGDTEGNTFSASFQASYNVAEQLGYPTLRVAPTGRLEAIVADRDGYTETGAGILNLTVGDDSIEQILPAVGLSVAGAWAAGDVTVRPEAQLLYEHLFGDNSVTTRSSIPTVGSTFATTVSTGDRDRLAVGLGTALDFSQTVSAHMRYDAPSPSTATSPSTTPPAASPSASDRRRLSWNWPAGAGSARLPCSLRRRKR
jgi:outer membrane autotransporter protein